MSGIGAGGRTQDIWAQHFYTPPQGSSSPWLQPHMDFVAGAVAGRLSFETAHTYSCNQVDNVAIVPFQPSYTLLAHDSWTGACPDLAVGSYSSLAECETQCNSLPSCHFIGHRVSDNWCEFWSHTCDAWFTVAGHDVYERTSPDLPPPSPDLPPPSPPSHAVCSASWTSSKMCSGGTSYSWAHSHPGDLQAASAACTAKAAEIGSTSGCCGLAYDWMKYMDGPNTYFINDHSSKSATMCTLPG